MSSELSIKYHSISIGDGNTWKNTWDDWHLIPSSRPLFNPPPVKTSFVEIPGGDGILDLTTAMTGKPMYSNRTGSWEFYVENGFKGWTVLYSEIMMYLHGQKLLAILDDDQAYYYEGRFSVNQWRSDPAQSLIVIDYNVYPYKKYVINDDKWLWDTFNFETGIIRFYKNLVVVETLTIDVIGDVMDTVPTIVVTNDMSVTYEGATYRLTRGANVNDSIVIRNGVNHFTFTGNGLVSFQIVGGRL